MLILRSDVTLVPVTLEQAPAMLRWMQDSVISSNIGLRQSPTLEKTEAWIRNASKASDIYARAVLFAGHHVGNVVLDKIDDYLGTARLSVYIGEETSRGSGVGTTSIYLTLREAFERPALHKIWLTVHSRNFPAINTYTRLGFVLEGILRDEFLIEEQKLNALYMGLLRPAFEELEAEYV